MTKCKHEWVWTKGYRVSVINEPHEYLRNETYNAECKKCNAKTWAHGHMPVARWSPTIYA